MSDDIKTVDLSDHATLMDCYKKLSKSHADLRADLAAEREKTGVSLTVGGGLQVYGALDAIHRVQQYILLDSRHPVESADVRRSLARALQAAEAERDALRAQLAEAREALEPFADMLMSYDASKRGWMLSECRPKIGALRRARAVLDKIKGGGDE